ncbi:MAG: TauD/TfdA dioxygenase family protein [Acidimicrobiia bacterium]
MTTTEPDIVTSAQRSAETAMSVKLHVDTVAYDGPAREWPFEVAPVSGYVGAAISGVDLSVPMSGDVKSALQEALAHYGVVFFRGQTIDDARHVAFGRQFGDIRMPAAYMELLADHPEICVISTENGKAYLTDQWHQDVSWPEAPPRYSILHMQAVPPYGSDTMWASLYLAFERLSPAMQSFLLTLTVRHAQPSNVDGMHFDHPLIIRHPISGRRSLYANPVFTHRINELTEAESTALLSYLYAHSTQPEFTCRWRWQPGDIAMWDNCYVMHYALGDYHPHYRKLHRIEIEGQPLLAARS